jgi:hypothetical protein
MGTMEATLELYRGRRRLFASSGRWLYPLLELERYLEASACERGELAVRDKVVGKAAALFLVHLGIRRVHAALLSSLAETVLHRYGVALTWERRVDRIACRTEELLSGVEDPEEGWRLVRERAAAPPRG